MEAKALASAILESFKRISTRIQPHPDSGNLSVAVLGHLRPSNWLDKDTAPPYSRQAALRPSEPKAPKVSVLSPEGSGPSAINSEQALPQTPRDMQPEICRPTFQPQASQNQPQNSLGLASPTGPNFTQRGADTSPRTTAALQPTNTADRHQPQHPGPTQEQTKTSSEKP